MDPALLYAAALLGTILVETGLARVLAPGAWKRLRVDTPLLNLLSHPLLTLVVWNGVLSLPAAEIGVILLETIGYRVLTRLSWPQAFGLSVVLNGVTWLTGILLFA